MGDEEYKRREMEKQERLKSIVSEAKRQDRETIEMSDKRAIGQWVLLGFAFAGFLFLCL